MKLILANGKELSPLVVLGGQKLVRGVSRDVLTFVFPDTESMEELDGIFTAENCESITIVDDEGNSYTHEGYTVRVELSKISVEVQPATADTEAVYEDRITVSMAQRTALEYEASETATALNALLTGEE